MLSSEGVRPSSDDKSDDKPLLAMRTSTVQVRSAGAPGLVRPQAHSGGLVNCVAYNRCRMAACSNCGNAHPYTPGRSDGPIWSLDIRYRHLSDREMLSTDTGFHKAGGNHGTCRTFVNKDVKSETARCSADEMRADCGSLAWRNGHRMWCRTAQLARREIGRQPVAGS
jgi:hypothetical protein